MLSSVEVFPWRWGVDTQLLFAGGKVKSCWCPLPEWKPVSADRRAMRDQRPKGVDRAGTTEWGREKTRDRGGRCVRPDVDRLLHRRPGSRPDTARPVDRYHRSDRVLGCARPGRHG